MCVLLWKVRKDLTCRDTKIVNAPEVLRSTRISEPVEVELNFTSVVRKNGASLCICCAKEMQILLVRI